MIMPAICTTESRQAALEPAIWLERHGDYLYRYALYRMRDHAAAEDVVQECLLAAIKCSDRFAGRSNERTWLVGILKHKIVDYLRAEMKNAQTENTDHPEDYFDREGAWRFDARPVSWTPDPGSLMESGDFRRVLERCLDELPGRLARVFILREIEGFATEEICDLLDITPSNLWVMLHRARLRLQSLLGLYWFSEAPEQLSTAQRNPTDNYASRSESGRGFLPSMSSKSYSSAS
jgi:RNA polymerase sigma-70 factor (ECF subfamily)